MNPVKIFKISASNLAQFNGNAELLGAVLLAAGVVGGLSYDRMGLAQTPVTAVVSQEVHYQEVHYEYFSGGKTDGRNIVTLTLTNTEQKGQQAKARFHFASSAEGFKQGDRVQATVHQPFAQDTDC